VSFYALVMDGKVLGFRDHIDELSLGLAERTAAVMWTEAPIAIYQVEARMPQDADRAMPLLERFLRDNPDLEPVSVVDCEVAPEGEDDEDHPHADVTGCYKRVDGEPGKSGFFASVSRVG
jgi:hypothetical protein